MDRMAVRLVFPLSVEFPDQALLLLSPFLVLRRRIDIRIIIKDRDLKIPGEVFQNITAARCTAAMEKQRRHPAPALKFLQFFS